MDRLNRLLTHFLQIPILLDASGMRGKMRGIPVQIGGKKPSSGAHFELKGEEIHFADQFRFIRGDASVDSPLKPIYFHVDTKGLERWLFGSFFRRPFLREAPSTECYAIALARLLGFSPIYVPEKNQETTLWLASFFSDKILHQEMEGKMRDPFGRFYAAALTSRRRGTTLFECLQKLKETEEMLHALRELKKKIESGERALLKAQDKRRYSFVLAEKKRLETKMCAIPLYPHVSHENLDLLIQAIEELSPPSIKMRPPRPSPKAESSLIIATYPSGMPLEAEDGSVFGENGELLARPGSGGWELFG